MSTWREVVYMILDNVKVNSDDSYITEDHVIYLIDTARATILKQAFKDSKNIPVEGNYQRLVVPVAPCIELQDTTFSTFKQEKRQRNLLCNKPIINKNLPQGIEYIPVPEPLSLGKCKIHTSTDFNSSEEISLVSRERFRYVGKNKYLQNIIYGTFEGGTTKNLYLKSANPQFLYLEEIIVYAVFESAKEAFYYSNKINSNKDVDIYESLMLSVFPFSEELIPTLIKTVVEIIAPTIYKPEDKKNNGNDDLSKVAVATSKKDK